jgi:hypothetical protein
MRHSIFFLALLCSISIISSCKKDSDDPSGSSTNVIFSSKFDNQSDLDLWSQSSGGQAIIDSSAVKFTNVTNCFHFETKNLIRVQSGKSYELRLTGKVNESLEGDPMLCAGDFIIWVVQGNENVISQSFGNYPAWTQKAFSFEAKSSASVKIEFLVGTTRGAWIDNLELVEN